MQQKSYLLKKIRKKRNFFRNYDNIIRHLLLILCLFAMIICIHLRKFSFYEGNNLENEMPLIFIQCTLR